MVTLSIIKISLFSILVIGIAILIVFSLVNLSQEKVVLLECSPEFWKNNLELWKIVGVDHNADFDETFGKDYFEPNITLEQAIGAEGFGIDHIARSGTTAYLNALADPQIDEESIRQAVHFGYVHQIDKYLENCQSIEKTIP